MFFITPYLLISTYTDICGYTTAHITSQLLLVSTDAYIYIYTLKLITAQNECKCISDINHLKTGLVLKY